MLARLTGDSKLMVGASVNSCPPLCDDPVRDWPPVKGLPCLLTAMSGNWISARKWIDGWMDFSQSPFK